MYLRLCSRHQDIVVYLRLCSRHQDIVVYLKSLRRRREKKFSTKTYYSAIQRKGPTGSTRGGGAQQASHYEIVTTEPRIRIVHIGACKTSLCTSNRLAGGAEKRIDYAATETDPQESGR